MRLMWTQHRLWTYILHTFNPSTSAPKIRLFRGVNIDFNLEQKQKIKQMIIWYTFKSERETVIQLSSSWGPNTITLKGLLCGYDYQGNLFFPTRNLSFQPTTQNIFLSQKKFVLSNLSLFSKLNTNWQI